MKSSSLNRAWRASVCVAILALAAGCTGSERFPAVDVGASPAKGDVLVGRVHRRGDHARPIGRVDEAVGYAASADPAAGEPMTALSPMSAEGAVYGAAEPTTAAEASEQQPAIASASIAIPQHGVNMDAGLGLGDAPTGAPVAEISGQGVQPQIVTDTGAMAIAEGATSQPVVDGIGFDEPVQVATGVATDEGQAAGDPEAGIGEGEILPLSVDSGNTGMETKPVARRKPAADCALYLDKRNCPQG